MSAVESAELAPGDRIARLIGGGWQPAGDHGPVDRERAIAELAAHPARRPQPSRSSATAPAGSGRSSSTT